MPPKKTSVTLGEDMRLKIAESLPKAIEHAMDSYRQFYEGVTITSAKDFSAHHTACKAAIAHVELLLKLAQWAHLPDESADDGLAALLSDAEAELKKHQHDGDEDA